jgi:hypothetical protein
LIEYLMDWWLDRLTDPTNFCNNSIVAAAL